jgi:ABC-type sugar transport system ATPase subunit
MLVMRNGRAAGILERSEATQEAVMQLMAGRNRASQPAPQTAQQVTA